MILLSSLKIGLPNPYITRIIGLGAAAGASLGAAGVGVTAAFSPIIADQIKFKYRYNSVSLWKYYKTSTKKYMLSAYTTIYTDKARTKVESVKISNDIAKAP